MKTHDEDLIIFFATFFFLSVVINEINSTVMIRFVIHEPIGNEYVDMDVRVVANEATVVVIII